MKKPVIVLVGRPNVGKSTLFNRLVGQRLAIIDETPGTTRDRLVSEGYWSGKDFFVVDTGGIDPPKRPDQQVLSVGSKDFVEEIRAQAEIAIEEADVVIFVVNVQDGVTQADREILTILRKRQTKKNGLATPPIVLAVNKTDNQKLALDANEFFSFGLGDPYPISAYHGTGTGDLLDAVVALFPEQTEEEETPDTIKVAIVGKPNAGKSSLLNKLAKEERAIVSPIAGTTRDAIDTEISFDDHKVTLIDTAGIRKRGSIIPGVEKYSVLRAMQAIERCNVALLVIDATTGITAQDEHIAGFIQEAKKSVILIINKWDAVEKDEKTAIEFENKVRQSLNFLPYVPVLFISAQSGQRVHQVMPLVIKVWQERQVKLTTSQINKVLTHAQDIHTAPSTTGHPFRIYYGTQVKIDPPTFLLFCNDPSLGHFTYMRFLENQLRSEYPFVGTPIQLVLKKH
ncbi:MAG TPA: ribosome biogenesis GTPase Der [Anaerolineaceae bacterium]|nr:ribosome biogenesis GTPase Der [Anaerolineaceae bacterium]